MKLPFPKYSHQVAKQSGSNFYLSFGILRPDQKAGMYAAYAFSRMVDDAVDREAPLEQKKSRLEHWRQELMGCYNGGAKHPVMRELALVIEHFQIPQQYFLDLIEGMMMDLSVHRYRTFSELQDYCYHVAGVVGLICNAIFGQRNQKAHDYALNLGTAFQLTNILRDVGTDVEQGRIYLPLEDLAQFQCSEQQIIDKVYTPEFYEVMQFEWERAKDFFDKAHDILPPEERRSLVAAEIMDGIYYRLLWKIRKRHFQVLGRKIKVPQYQKLFVLLSAWMRARLA